MTEDSTRSPMIDESAAIVSRLSLCLFTLLLTAACADPSPAPSPPLPPSTPASPASSAPLPLSTPASPASSTLLPPSAPPAPFPLEEMDVERVFSSLSFARMTYLTHAGDGSGRLFLVLQPGRIMVFPNDPGAAGAATFLDIRDRVSDRGNEEGLLGLAFDPGHSENGYLYVYYSAAEPRRSVISRFSVAADGDAADPASERVLLEILQPFSNHNGGQIAFGPDGYLYVGVGDGGKAGDPFDSGQDRSTLLGSILRIDVASVGEDGSYGIPQDNPFAADLEGARPEIWAYGLRNPWRFSFDPETGELWAADVGQNRYEEIDLILPGRNYGWNVMEGSSCFSPPRGCNAEGLEPPIAEYGRGDGCSVTGGYVYRGSRLPSLYGAYVYGDFCSGKIWALRYDGSAVTEHLELVDSELRISSFGVGQSGELYILSFDEKIYRLVESR